MERIALSSGGSKVKESFRSENNFKFDKDYPYAYPWPPRYYTCSFCQREFKSAQALGGHMNIHRRDRAKLRDQASPPPNNDHINDNLDQNPSLNPNPNPSPSPVSFVHPCSTSNSNSNIYAHQYSLVSLSLSSLPPPLMKNNGEKLGPATTGDGFGREYPEQRFEKWKYSMSSTFEHHHEEREVRILNHGGSTTKEIVRLDLELCLGDHANQDLDLELRLGI